MEKRQIDLSKDILPWDVPGAPPILVVWDFSRVNALSEVSVCSCRTWNFSFCDNWALLMKSETSSSTDFEIKC